MSKYRKITFSIVFFLECLVKKEEISAESKSGCGM
jgi:hypothetical protein